MAPDPPVSHGCGSAFCEAASVTRKLPSGGFEAMRNHARNFAHMAAYLNGTSRLGKGKRKRSTSLAAVRAGAR
jgi:hypothetical protein